MKPGVSYYGRIKNRRADEVEEDGNVREAGPWSRILVRCSGYKRQALGGLVLQEFAF